jgi:hypothetical protein
MTPLRLDLRLDLTNKKELIEAQARHPKLDGSKPVDALIRDMI